jgi:hypothetical protein
MGVESLQRHFDTPHPRLDQSAGDETSEPFVVGPGRWWDVAMRHVAVEHLRRRAIFAKVKPGWFDAGMLWQETNSHASAVIGLLDVLDHAPAARLATMAADVAEQARVGLAYLDRVQDLAASRGHAAGALSHQAWDMEDELIVGDSSKAALAWALAARVLPNATAEERAGWRKRAAAAIAWTLAQSPDNNVNFERIQHGVPTTYMPPRGLMTRDLLATAHAAVELARGGDTDMQSLAVTLVARALDRQASAAEARHGYHGFLFALDDRAFMEKAWTHQIKGRPLGADAGGTFGNHFDPVIKLLADHPAHPDAPRWRAALEAFTSGYLLPACAANPFRLLPLGIFDGHGPLWFAGPWHGTNCIYGLAAGLALDLARVLPGHRVALREIAAGNLLWVGGLNGGLSRPALIGCVVENQDLPPDRAVPVSMIFGVGDRWAGGWLAARGSVCNGFCVGKQFEFDTPATTANDGPHSLTDEDWIPHATAWASGLARWERDRMSM